MTEVFHSGLFYVIEGFLDILLPVEEPTGRMMSQSKPSRAGSDPRSIPESKSGSEKPQHQKLLFTVKPGGIAGYLGTLFPPILMQPSTSGN
jgi:lysophospholipid hydrolase